MRGNTVLGGNIGVGIAASGVVIDNYVTGFGRGIGIDATGTLRGNIATHDVVGIHAGVGSTVIGNTFAGLQANCPSNRTDNTAVNNTVQDLLLEGQGCHNEDNVAPKTQP